MALQSQKMTPEMMNFLQQQAGGQMTPYMQQQMANRMAYNSPDGGGADTTYSDRPLSTAPWDGGTFASEGAALDNPLGPNVNPGVNSFHPLEDVYTNAMDQFLKHQGNFDPVEYYDGETVAPVSALTSGAINNMDAYLQGQGADTANSIMQHGLNAQQGTTAALAEVNQLMQGGGYRDVDSMNIGSQNVNAQQISAPGNQVNASMVNGPQGQAAMMQAAQLGNAPMAQAAQLGQANMVGDPTQVNAQRLNGVNQGTIDQIYNNPALNGAIDASLRDVTRSLTENELPSNAMAAIGAGSAGSSRRGVMDAISTRGAMDRMADISSQMRNSAFNQGVGVASQQALANQGTNLAGQQSNQGANLQAALSNQNAGNQFALQNAGFQQQTGLANQGMAGQYGLAQGQMNQNANAANQSALNQMTGMNMGYNMQGQLANQQAGLQAQQFNNQQGLQASLANQQAALQAAQGNQNAALSAAQSNQNSALQAGMANQQADLASLQNQLGAAGLSQQIGQYGTQNAIGANNMMMNNMQAGANMGLLHQALDQQGINANMQEHMFNQLSPYMTQQLLMQSLAPPPGMPFHFGGEGSVATSGGGSNAGSNFFAGIAAGNSGGPFS